MLPLLLLFRADTVVIIKEVNPDQATCPDGVGEKQCGLLVLIRLEFEGVQGRIA